MEIGLSKIHIFKQARRDVVQCITREVGPSARVDLGCLWNGCHKEKCEGEMFIISLLVVP